MITRRPVPGSGSASRFPARSDNGGNPRTLAFPAEICHALSGTHDSIRRAAGEAQLQVSVRIHGDPAGGALLGTASGAVRAFFWVLAGRGPTVPDNIVLIMRFHPVGGEDVSVVCEDFAGEREALEAVARALDERRSLVLTRARYDRRDDENGVIINLANVVSVRLSKTDSAAAGQYL